MSYQRTSYENHGAPSLKANTIAFSAAYYSILVVAHLPWGDILPEEAYMNTSKPRRWNIMPSFSSLTIPEIQDKDGEVKEIGQFIVKTRPLGFRGIRCLSWLLHLFPYITGSIPKIRITIKHTSLIRTIPFTVAVFEARNGNISKTILIEKSDTGEYVGDIEASMISKSGQHRYSINLQSKVNAPCNYDIVVFKAIAQENITLIVFGLLLGFVSSFLTWLLAR